MFETYYILTGRYGPQLLKLFFGFLVELAVAQFYASESKSAKSFDCFDFWDPDFPNSFGKNDPHGPIRPNRYQEHDLIFIL